MHGERTGYRLRRPADGAAVRGIHHVFITVNDVQRSRSFYTALMPRLGYPGVWNYAADGLASG